jgi:hypothetical protein
MFQSWARPKKGPKAENPPVWCRAAVLELALPKGHLVFASRWGSTCPRTMRGSWVVALLFGLIGTRAGALHDDAIAAAFSSPGLGAASTCTVPLLAPVGKASQISSYKLGNKVRGPAHHAVDDNHRTIAVTEEADDPWWQLDMNADLNETADMGARFNAVRWVNVFNRLDPPDEPRRCEMRLFGPNQCPKIPWPPRSKGPWQGAVVGVSATPCTSEPHSPQKQGQQ